MCDARVARSDLAIFAGADVVGHTVGARGVQLSADGGAPLAARELQVGLRIAFLGDGQLEGRGETAPCDGLHVVRGDMVHGVCAVVPAIVGSLP